MVKEKIRRFIKNQIDKFEGYLSMKKSLDHLMEVAKDFHFISIGINEINDGIKNPGQFKLVILNLIYFVIFVFMVILISLSNYLYSS